MTIKELLEARGLACRDGGEDIVVCLEMRGHEIIAYELRGE